MCTLVILRRPGHRWPVLIGANRDEMIDRPWEPPGRHWPDRPEVVAGLDRLAADLQTIYLKAGSLTRKDETREIRSPTQLLDAIFEWGRKGVALQRYKLSIKPNVRVA